MTRGQIHIGDMSHEEAVGILKLMLEAMEAYDGISPTPKRVNAMKMAIESLEQEPNISLEVYKQVAKERDIAIQQLHELGYEFGQKIEPTTKKDLGVEKIIDELEKEFEKVNIPIMDKLTLFAKTQNALYRCADMRNEEV